MNDPINDLPLALGAVRILGKPYTVTLHPESDLENTCYGRVQCHKGRIHLEAGQSHDALRDTLLHECVHAIDYAMKTGLEERQVSTLATGIYALLKDNPDFAAFLTAPDPNL